MENNELKKVRVIFTIALAEHLCKNGFFRDLKKVEKNNKPGYENKKVWIFYESEELNQAIEDYIRSRPKFN